MDSGSNPVARAQDFYDTLVENYHLIYHDWRHEGVPYQGTVLHRLIQSILHRHPLSILDCSCGIGTQAIGLALHGYRVRASDISVKAVARATREAELFQVPLDVQVADLRSLSTQVDGRFDVVLTCDNSLSHLITDDDLLLAARNMAAKLESGGLLLIGIRDHEESRYYERLTGEKPRTSSPQVIDGDDGYRIVFQVWDWDENGRTYLMHLFILQKIEDRWQTHEYQSQIRALRRVELDEILLTAGFEDPCWHLPVETGYHQPIVTARRQSV